MKIEKVDTNFQTSNYLENNIKFYKVNTQSFNIHGLLWYEQNLNFHRLLDTNFIDEKINFLQKHPSGGYLSFKTDSTKIDLRVELAQSSYMPHMSAIGQTGLDLYVLYNNHYIFICNTKIDKVNYEINLFNKFPKEPRQFRLYLPLYVELKSLEIGVDQDSFIEKSEPILEDKIVCYGTSITQGGCVTRPGMSYSSIIGRELNYEIINLGFSGNGHLHFNIAEMISSIENMKYLVIEVEANAGAIGVLKDRLENFIDIILKKIPNLKIFLISHFPYGISLFKNEIRSIIDNYKMYQRNLEIKYKYNLIFIDGEEILRDLNYDETVDGIHLTDLGFYYVAKVIINKIKKY